MRFSLGLAVALAGVSVAHADGLQDRLGQFLAQRHFAGAEWGVKVVSLDSGKTLFEQGADLRLSPASNCKLYAASLALATLGADYRIVTPILATAAPDSGGVVHGDLVVAGRGDPSWDFRYPRREFWTVFDPFVAAVRAAHVTRITGDIVADASWLREPPQGASWTADDMESDYGAEISAVCLADNYADLHLTPAAAAGQPCSAQLLQPLTGIVIDNRVTTVAADGERLVRIEHRPGEATFYLFGTLPLGARPDLETLPVPHPAAWFAACLRAALLHAGITLDGSIRAEQWPDTKRPGRTALPGASPDSGIPAPVSIGQITSPPLRDLETHFLKVSQNLEADLIFAHVGELQRTAATPPWIRSDELAVTALDAFLAKIGVPPGSVLFDEGSGLSRNNLATASATVTLLAAMARHPGWDLLASELPVAGVDGTLRRRFRGTPAEGKLRAKTGTLRWANALSGYVTTAGGDHLVFSFMLNRYVPAPEHKGGAELDALAGLLADFGTGHSVEPTPAP